jgi:hypothetical protein
LEGDRVNQRLLKLAEDAENLTYDSMP